MIATNTIAQGDTREIVDDLLGDEAGHLYRATTSRSWPGEAGVEVSQLWLTRGDWTGSVFLDDERVRVLDGYLSVPGRIRGEPFPLAAARGRAYVGSYVHGAGFLLEEEEAQALLRRAPRSADVLFPFLRGRDLGTRPDQSPSCWVIDFRDWPLERAATYGEAFRVVVERVKPERRKKAERRLRESWWKHARQSVGLRQALAAHQLAFVRPYSNTHAPNTTARRRGRIRQRDLSPHRLLGGIRSYRVGRA